ncbi:hypothetical protein U9M48_002942 [Paspalum notatum var. saurae]|uniref:Uncharacterized protein n=1 Tax=Paspalum notatum var. saurae TaxID=547442 RepID=A0AAQ3PIG8_PASNO
MYPSSLQLVLLLSLEPRKKKAFPLKLLPQDPPLEAIGDHGAPLPSSLGQEGARDPISLPFDFQHLGAAQCTSSILGTRKVSSTMLSCRCRQSGCMVELILCYSGDVPWIRASLYIISAA